MLRRSRARFFGIIALAAIALQMVVALGHSHAGTGQLAGFVSASVHGLDNTGTTCPAPLHHPADNEQSDSTCLICLAAHQAAAALPPATPEIVFSDRTAPARKPFVSAPERGRTGVANFFARGPPSG